MLHMDKENIHRLKWEIENEIIIAERKQSIFAKKVPLDVLTRMIEFIDFKMAETEMLNNEIRDRDERIRKLSEYIDSRKEKIAELREKTKKGITFTLELDKEQVEQISDAILEKHEYNIQAIYERTINNLSERMIETLCHNSDGRNNIGHRYLYHDSIRTLIEREKENLIGEGI